MTARKTSNPRTEQQQAHRAGFGLVARLSSDLKALHTIGLYKESTRRRRVQKRPTTYDAFRRLNKHCVRAEGVDYRAVVVSKGPLSAPEFELVHLGSNGRLTVEFSSEFYTGEGSDQLLLAVYCPDRRACYCADAVSREEGRLVAQLPVEWLAHTLHLYAFFCGRNMLASKSVYYALHGCEADPIKRKSDPIKRKSDPIKGGFDPINAPADPIKGDFDLIKGDADPITARLFAALRADGTLTYAAYAAELGISEATVKRRLAALKAQNLIARSGSNKSGRWEVLQ